MVFSGQLVMMLPFFYVTVSEPCFKDGQLIINNHATTSSSDHEDLVTTVQRQTAPVAVMFQTSASDDVGASATLLGGSRTLDDRATDLFAADYAMTTGHDVTEQVSTPSDVQEIDDDEIAFYIIFYKLTVPTLFGIVTLVGLVGNAFVIYTVLSRSDMRRNAVNLLLLNLAVRYVDRRQVYEERTISS